VAAIALCVDLTLTFIDLGCGPYAIMAMLSRKIFAWRGVCIESDAESRELARQNLAANFDSGIEMILHEPSPDRLLPCLETNGAKCGDKRIGEANYVLLCNPPWFAGDDVDNHEKETKGGEVEFVSRVLSEAPRNIRAFCFLIGRKANVGRIVKLAKAKGAKTMERKMQQGRKTRYFVGVTFEDFHDLEKQPKRVKLEERIIEKEIEASGSLTAWKQKLDSWMSSSKINYKVLLSRNQY